MKTLMRRCAAIVLGLTLGLTAWAGLETVTHIQDLNSSWPLGSDLASTSDDHIRNIKSALKTDFPNFNGTYTSAAAPVFGIPSDTNTGMYSVAADDLGFSTGGTLRFDISTTAFTGTLPWRGQDGTQAAPALTFSGDTDTGFYRVGANTLGVSAGNTLVAHLKIDGSGNPQIAGPDGSAAVPGFSFFNDVDTGIYRDTNNRVSFATAGARTFFIQSTFVQSDVQFATADGTAGFPGYTFNQDADTGFYRDTNNQIGIALGGSTAGQIAQGTFTITMTGGTTSPTGTAEYQRVGNVVTLFIPSISATSNANTFTFTGIPSIIQSTNATGEFYIGSMINSGAATNVATAMLAAGSGTLTLLLNGSSSGWVNSGTKGSSTNGVTVTYRVR